MHLLSFHFESLILICNHLFVYFTQGNSPRAIELSNAIQAHLRSLEQQVGQAVSMAVRSGITRPAYTLAGKMEQAQRWLNNPSFDDKGLGQLWSYSLFNIGGVSTSSWNHPEVNQPEISFLYLIHKTSLQSHYAKLHILPTFYWLSTDQNGYMGAWHTKIHH